MIRSKQQQERIATRIQKTAKTRREKHEPHPNRKHDWDLIEALYMAGMSLAELKQIPECSELSKDYLEKRAYTQGWPEKRKMIQQQFVANASKTVGDRMKDAVNDHYTFMLKEINDERAIYARRVKSTSIDDQKERIDLLTRLEGIVRKTLGLDNMTPADANRNSFNQMIVIHNTGTPLQGEQVRSATLPLLSDSKVTTGPLGAKNEPIEAELSPTITGEPQDTGQDRTTTGPTPTRLLPTINLSPADLLRVHRMKGIGKE